MKHFILVSCLSVALISCGDSGSKKDETTTAAPDSSKMAAAPANETPEAPMDSAAMMKAWQSYMTPGEEHKLLAKANGKWNEEITMWMSPDAPPTKNTATAENKMIMNGLYQYSTHKGNFMGMPFEGISTTGYDNARKIYVSTWIDNMGSGIMHMEGPYDAATKTVTLSGTATDPMTGKAMEVRETMKTIDDNTQFMEMFETRGGKERKTMEIKFTRK